MHARFFLFPLLALLCLLGLPARANHSVGGELELLYVSGTRYLLRINLYIDGRAMAPPENTLIASFFDKSTDRRLMDVQVPLANSSTVPYTNPACTSSGLYTLKRVYEKEVDLSPGTYLSGGGYYVAVEHCCRNDVTTNIQNPGNAGQAFYLEFSAIVRNGQPFIDSSPTAFPPIGDYACLGELFYFDFGGRDPDGDSLAYDLVTPLEGHATRSSPRPSAAGAAPYAAVSWDPGLTTQYQMPGSPTLAIEARTGRLTVRPTELGLYVFGVRCRQYRGGVQIGATWRDYQIYVLNCLRNVAPVVQVQPGSTGATTYVPGRDTLHLSPDGDHCLRVRFTDTEPGSRLTVTVRPVNFTTPVPVLSGTTTGTVNTGTTTDTLTATLCFPACVDTKGQVFLLDVMVADNGCSLPKRDTVRVAFTADAPPNLPAVLTSTLPPPNVPDVEPAVVRLALGSTYTATLTGTDPDASPLSLSADGQGFALAAAGMAFEAENGTGRATGTFRWTATCEAAHLGAEGLTVSFRLHETACQTDDQLRVVRFEVTTTPDTAAFVPPNIITPNHDGRNDDFALPDLPPDVCDVRFAGIKIFSRWGREVFASEARDFRWGGMGTAGTYYYLVTYSDGRRLKGWLQVVAGE